MLRRISLFAVVSGLVVPGAAQAHGTAASAAAAAQPAQVAAVSASTASRREHTVSGVHARLLASGLAAVPEDAPAKVKAIVAAANEIVGKPYKWGGGHGTLVDSGYDCSGAVSYALVKAGLLDAPATSTMFASVLAAGAGEAVTVYGNPEHVYLEVAGLRLDTSSYGDPGGLAGVHWRPVVGQRAGFTASHPVGL